MYRFSGTSDPITEILIPHHSRNFCIADTPVGLLLRQVPFTHHRIKLSFCMLLFWCLIRWTLCLFHLSQNPFQLSHTPTRSTLHRWCFQTVTCSPGRLAESLFPLTSIPYDRARSYRRSQVHFPIRYTRNFHRCHSLWLKSYLFSLVQGRHDQVRIDVYAH